MTSTFRMPMPPSADQAEGLRRMFGHGRVRFVPVVSNPHIAFGGVILERLCTAWAERGATTLVVDAGERAGEPGEMAMIDLGQCVEPLSPDVFFLAARGLPLRFVDATGSTRSFLHAVADAAPRCDTVLVHASAADLCRLFAHRPARSGDSGDAPCPIVLADDRPASVTHAYAATKLLAHRAGLAVFDLVLGAAPHSPRAERIVEKIAGCADTYFGGVLRHAARIDPAGEASEPPNAALRRLVAASLPQRPGAAAPPRRAPRAATAIAPPLHRPQPLAIP